MPSGGLNSPLDAWIRDRAEALGRIDEAPLDALLDRIGEAQVVLLGEASHGTSEFYRMRNRITRALVEAKGFNLIAVEADWPDAEHLDDYARQRNPKAVRPRETFARFPAWMWRNTDVLGFIEWLRTHNEALGDPDRQVSFHGLDLYSLYHSIHEVISFLERADPPLANLAHERYSCLLAFEPEPQEYGSAVRSSRHQSCEGEAAAMLRSLLTKRLPEVSAGRHAVFDAEQNARVVANSEAYYRAIYHGGPSSWNQRDTHMFETLQRLLEVRGPDAKAVVWAHNSHIGNAAATQMGARGELNLGELCRGAFGERSYHIGFGTDHGTVAAADRWGGPVRVKDVRPSLPGSIERLCHQTGIPRFTCPLRESPAGGREVPLLERAIGVIYRPETERLSHYFEAIVPEQFDEYIWFAESQAVTPLTRESAPRLPPKHPFALRD